MFGSPGKHSRQNEIYSPGRHVRTKLDGQNSPDPSVYTPWDDGFDYDEADLSVPQTKSAAATYISNPSHLASQQTQQAAADSSPTTRAMYASHDTRPHSSPSGHMPDHASTSHDQGPAATTTTSAAIRAQPRRPKPTPLATVLRALIGRDIVVELLDLPQYQTLPMNIPSGIHGSSQVHYFTHELAQAQLEIREKYGFSAPALVLNPQIQLELAQVESNDTRTKRATTLFSTPHPVWPLAEVRGTLESARDDHTLTLVNTEIRAVVAGSVSTTSAAVASTDTDPHQPAILFGKWIKAPSIRIPGSRVGTIKLPNGTHIAKLLYRHQKDLEALLRKQQRGVRKTPMPGSLQRLRVDTNGNDND